MASISESRSGGKMLRTRRPASARTRTPYARPAPPSQPPSPNWLSRFVLSPTRIIASGAGKLISSVLLDSSPTSDDDDTSSSSSSEEVDAFDEENSPVEGDVASNKGLQPFVWSSKNKHTIEQLLMEESFSREECDRLINILRSRVVDPANDDDGDKGPTDIPNKTLGSDSPDLHSAAVMEAKKWLQEKKSGLDSNSDIGYGSPSLNLVTLPQLAVKDEGSPVDIAKLYMRSLPPWASPSIDHTKPPTLPGIRLFKEETPHLFGDNSMSSSKLKRDSSATGSWSIQDEIRRVRSRATEEMLRTLPSSKVDWSAFTVEHKNNVNSSAIENIGASLGERVYSSANMAKGLGSLTTPDSESNRDGFLPESVLSGPAYINFEQNQGSVAVQQTTGTQNDIIEMTTSGLRDRSSDELHRDCDLVKVNGINGTNGSDHQLDSVVETREALNSRLEVGKEKAVAEDALANGFPSSGPCFIAEQIIEENTKTSDNEPNTIDSSQEKRAQGGVERETSKVLRESTEVPDAIVEDSIALKEDDGVVASGSQNSSSAQYEVQQNNSLAGSEPGLAATPSSIAKQKGERLSTPSSIAKQKGERRSTPSSIAKHKGERLSRYNRRTRSKGVK